jgi:hypothetical protein
VLNGQQRIDTQGRLSYIALTKNAVLIKSDKSNGKKASNLFGKGG